jgi:hypothetical protein
MPIMGELSRGYISEESNIDQHTVVVRGTGAHSFKIPTADNQEILGVIAYDSGFQDALRQGGIDFTGRTFSVDVGQSFVEVKAVGAISEGDKLIVAAGGGVKKMPTVAGTYNVIGEADGDAVNGEYFDMLTYRQVVVIP